MLRAEQIRAARALLDWSQSRLAEAAGVSLPTVKRIEGKGPGRSAVDTLVAIESALEQAGVVFIAENGGGGAGVRMRGPAKREE
ncbi:MAG: helix-turn-helix domain-containing protein [Paracoccaceae bacterium]